MYYWHNTPFSCLTASRFWQYWSSEAHVICNPYVYGSSTATKRLPTLQYLLNVLDPHKTQVFLDKELDWSLHASSDFHQQSSRDSSCNWTSIPPGKDRRVYKQLGTKVCIESSILSLNPFNPSWCRHRSRFGFEPQMHYHRNTACIDTTQWWYQTNVSLNKPSSYLSGLLPPKGAQQM